MTVVTSTPVMPPLLAQAIESRDLALKLRDDPVAHLRPVIVAIACAAMAVEAAVNWLADRHDREWLDEYEKTPTPRKMKLWLRRHGTSLNLGSEFGRRVRALFCDRDMVVHPHGVPEASGKLVLHQPPVESDRGITAIRAYFTPERAQVHVATAQEAIAVVKGALLPQ